MYTQDQEQEYEGYEMMDWPTKTSNQPTPTTQTKTNQTATKTGRKNKIFPN